MVQRIGLTGGIGSGKSSVLKMLQTHNIPTIDADAIVHDLYASDEFLQDQIRETFGTGVFNPDGKIDTRQLGVQVFQNPPALKQLEEWIHPKVREKVSEFFKAHETKPLAVAEIPLIYESDIAHLFDEIWVVWATPDQQIERLTHHRRFSEAEARQRLARQIPLAKKCQQAHVVIDNAGTPENTAAQIKDQLARFKG